MFEKSTWEKFFDAHAPIYKDNVFTKNTIREVDFLMEDRCQAPCDGVPEMHRQEPPLIKRCRHPSVVGAARLPHHR